MIFQTYTSYNASNLKFCRDLSKPLSCQQIHFIRDLEEIRRIVAERLAPYPSKHFREPRKIGRSTNLRANTRYNVTRHESEKPWSEKKHETALRELTPGDWISAQIESVDERSLDGLLGRPEVQAQQRPLLRVRRENDQGANTERRPRRNTRS